jgi:uncharacterized membrane protein
MLKRPTFGGIVVALVFFWQSLSPTLLPRTALHQAAITGVCVAIGYGIGTFAGWLGHLGLRRWWREPSARAKRIAWIVLAAMAALALLGAVLVWVPWQNDQRDLVGMEHLGMTAVAPMLLLAAVVTVVLVLIGRAVGLAVRALHRFFVRRLPWGIAQAVTVAAVIVVAVVVFRDVLAEGFTSWANSTYSAFDKDTQEGIEQPDSPTVSGSPESLAPWDTLGYQGRTFVATAQTIDELEEFHGPDTDVMEPIRVYVGLRSADTEEERAELAVQELERTGAFERDVLVVITVTGTGFVDPPAAAAIEQLHAGNTALVAMQYSYLPSWISFLTDKDKASAAGSALFHAVRERWLEVTEASRPQLIVFGLSLGAFGAEAAFTGQDAAASVANVVEKTDGALFVGSPNDSEMWRQITVARDDGSPAWRPVYDDAEVVRFANQGIEVAELDPSWEPPRVLYYQHPTDPVTFTTFSDFWNPPEWMDDPRGFGVPDRGRWFPIVTGVQSVFDLMAGFGAPPGFGHDYTAEYVAAWAQVVPPDGWTDVDTEKLQQFLDGS